MRHLEIHPGGKLIQLEWNSESGDYDQSDVTDHAPRFLWDEVRLNDETTVNDIFLLLDKHIEIFDLIIGNWCKDFVKEALSQDFNGESELEYAELSWRFTLNYHHEREDERVLNGHHFPDFGAIGKDGINYGVSFTPTYELKRLPLRLNPSSTLFNEGEYYRNKDNKNPSKYSENIQNVSYNLGHVLFGIIWELSLYGDPKKRDEVKADIDRRVEEVENGTADTIQFEEVMSQIKANLEETE